MKAKIAGWVTSIILILVIVKSPATVAGWVNALFGLLNSLASMASQIHI